MYLNPPALSFRDNTPHPPPHPLKLHQARQNGPARVPTRGGDSGWRRGGPVRAEGRSGGRGRETGKAAGRPPPSRGLAPRRPCCPAHRSCGCGALGPWNLVAPSVPRCGSAPRAVPADPGLRPWAASRAPAPRAVACRRAERQGGRAAASPNPAGPPHKTARPGMGAGVPRRTPRTPRPRTPHPSDRAQHSMHRPDQQRINAGSMGSGGGQTTTRSLYAVSHSRATTGSGAKAAPAVALRSGGRSVLRERGVEGRLR